MIDLPVRTRRLQIRRVAAEDWEGILQLHADFSGSPYAQYDGPHELMPAKVRENVQKWASISQEGKPCSWQYALRKH